MEIKNRGAAVYMPIVIALCVIAGLLIGRFYSGSHTENRFIIIPKANKLDNVLNYIEDEYVDEVSKNDLVEHTIPKILENLDPHSQYIPASELQKVNEPLVGNFCGIGIQFNMLSDTLVVIQTVANGPSQKIGVLAGDRVITVDGVKVAGVKMPSDSIVNKLRGTCGTKVSVQVLRRNLKSLLPFTITRDNIPLYSVDVDYMVNNDIGFIRLNKFSSTTFEEFEAAVKDLEAQGMKKLILDLRENGGGYMDAAVNIADQFLADNELIVYTKGRARDKEEFRSTPGGICKDIKLVVLIDETSASASEILAGAIQDNDRGIIIGRRSFGKGLVQEQKTLADGSAIRLTVARYYTPTGRCIQKPYSKGLDNYYNDLNYRYEHGELANADSNKYSDTMKYVTPKGKIVYGGGGIMPDIFVPLDSVGITRYYIDIRNKGLIYQFSLKYADEHRNVLAKFTSPDEFVKYLNKQNVLRKFITYAAGQGIKEVPKDIRVSGDIIKTQLDANIARNFLDNKGYFPIIQGIDNTLEKAIEVLSK